jgi:hypothetical protein
VADAVWLVSRLRLPLPHTDLMDGAACRPGIDRAAQRVPSRRGNDWV